MSFAQHFVSIVTFIFLLSIFYYYILLFIKPKKGKPVKRFSSVTIIVPAHNEEAYIKDTIDAIKAARFNGKKEIIVVDDGSIDTTAQIVSKCRGVKLMRTKHSGKSASINRALSVAKGELIAIVDGDSYIHKNALQELAKEVARKGVVGACGVVKVKNRNKFLCMWPHIEQLYNSLMRSVFSKINANIVTPGALSMYRTKQLKQMGGFGTDGFSEDIDVTIRLIRKGHKIGFAETAVSETNNPYTLKEFFRQRFRMARGLINILKRHLQLNTAMIDVFTLPLLLFAYIQAVIMGSFTIYQIVFGYTTYFASQGVFFNLNVFRFFFEWFSIIGFVRWAAGVFSGSTPLSFVTAVGIIATLLTYPLYIIAIAKYDKRFDAWHLIPVFFMFPFWLLIMVIYTMSVPEYFRKKQFNIWKKNE